MTTDHRTRCGPCPARIRRQISTGAEIDYDALLSWWEHRAPAWLRESGLTITTAAVLSVVPASKLRDAPGRLRFTISPSA